MIHQYIYYMTACFLGYLGIGVAWFLLDPSIGQARGPRLVLMPSLRATAFLMLFVLAQEPQHHLILRFVSDTPSKAMATPTTTESVLSLHGQFCSHVRRQCMLIYYILYIYMYIFIRT